MGKTTRQVGEKLIIGVSGLQELMNALAGEGYQIVGPTIRDQAIVYEALSSVEDLPIGWTDEQSGGKYRLIKRNDDAHFGYVVGPHSWKKFLQPAHVKLWQATREGASFTVTPNNEPVPRYAFFGVRACELHAIAIQDKVFTASEHTDPIYKSRRDAAFIIAVNCAQSANTCFCVSMNTGPRAEKGFDLALTEIIESGRHDFFVEIGTQRGAEIIERVTHAKAQNADEETALAITAKTSREMVRSMETDGIKELLSRNHDHPRWDNIASRCLTCANCTMVCPTCFCSTVEDVTDLTGEHAERWRKWDSCFTMDFSYIHGGSFRSTTKSRYRQWMTHKLSSWIDQFGTSGCVGCGRCITWCPPAIDITEEIRAIRETEKEKKHGDA